MAIQTLVTIKNWFKTGLIPTQAQFWDTWDSFRHKLESIPVADINGLNELFTPFNNHLNDDNAHASLFVKAKIYATGQLQIFKRPGNTNNSSLEVNDLVVGIVETAFIKGIYQGGDALLLASYSIIDQLDF